MVVHVRLLVAAFAWVLVVLAFEKPLLAQPWFPSISHHCARTRCCIPQYNYGHDLERFRDRVVAIADPVIPTKWYKQSVTSYEQVDACWQRSVVEEPQPLISDEQEAKLVRTVRRKPFHFPTASLTANNVTLRQVGLSIYNTGHITASGRMTHDGGPDGSLQGANVRLYLRAYAAPNPRSAALNPPPVVAETDSTPPTAETAAPNLEIAARRLPLDSTVVWQSKHDLWIARNQPQVVLLTPSEKIYAPPLRLHFDEITHLEVELVAQRDR